MTSQELLDLATRLATDLTHWSAEATRLDAISTEELAVLRSAATVIERTTERAVMARVNDVPEQQQLLSGESVTRPDDTLGG